MELTTGALSSGDDRDRLSQLPDPVLHYILSKGLLHMDDVVRTCILSKRWRNLWASTPHLLFNHSHWRFFSTDPSRENKIDFPQFVDTVLLLRDASPPDVQTFHLFWAEDFCERIGHHLAKWLKYAVNHNVKGLEFIIDFDEEKVFELPRCVFSCRSLERLFLNFVEKFMEVPDVVSLDRLRVLVLARFTLTCVSLQVLICGCPVLEDLDLFRCKIQDPDISSISLQKLFIHGCRIQGARVRISSPSLRTLNFSGNTFEKLDLSLENLDSPYVSPDILLENLSSLSKACIPIDNCEVEVFNDSTPEPINFINPRSKGLSKTKLSEIQTFQNLKKLELFGWSVLENFPAVNHFLQRSPDLELLTLVSESATEEKKSSKLFDCPHSKLYIRVECGQENEKILELVTDFVKGKCGCFQEYLSTA